MKKIILSLFISLLFISCGKKDALFPIRSNSNESASYNKSAVLKTSKRAINSFSASSNDSVRLESAAMEVPVYSDMTNVIGKSSSATGSAKKSASQDSSSSVQVERKLIKNGNVSLKVDSLENSDANIELWTKTFYGYVSNSDMYNNNCNYTVRIPAEKFDAAMSSLGDFGKVLSRSVSIDDVTERFYDLQSRLEAKKILREKYNQYLKQANNMKDLLEVERQLNNVISELESMEGQMKRLSNEITYSTIYINITAETSEIEPVYSLNKIEWKKLVYNIGNFFIAFFVFIIDVIIYGIPVLALVSILYWLLLGKIGLLKQFFALLNGKKSKKEEK